MKSLCIPVLCVLSAVCAAAANDPVVTVPGGKIQGRLLAAPGGASFKGVPFAAPPLGDLRWREPAPVQPWQGVRDADAFGASCVQQISAWNQQEAQGNQEDCLYLNVWTPEWPSTGKKPVMFWIYGGGNTAGGASVDYFDGASLSRRGVVLVTINYRMGVFGYFAHPALSSESAHHASGNYGLLDLLAGLKWVHENIERFGGDPANVTVFGQSAGGGNTGALFTSPLAKGLFHRIIQQSGAANRNVATQREAEQAGEKFAASMQLPAGKDGIKALRAIPAQDLLKAANAARGTGPNMAPSEDGWFMPASAARVFAAAREPAVPLMIGSNSQEQNGPKDDELRKLVAGAYGINADKALAYYGLSGPGAGNSDPLYGSASKQFWADSRQRCGSEQEALWHVATRAPVYRYQFDRAIAGRPATQHSAELPYVFGNLLPGGFLGGPFTDADRRISNDLQVYWTNFARSGDPNGGGLPAWPKYDANARNYLEFTDNGPVARAGLRRQICDLYIDNQRRHMTGG